MFSRLRRQSWVVVFALIFGLTNGASGQTDGPIKNVFWQPNELRQGSVVFFTVEMEKSARKVSGTLLGKELTFFRGTKPNVWAALGGVDMDAVPGSYDVAIRAVLSNGHITRTNKKLEITSGDFKEGTIEVPQNFVTPDAAAKKQIEKDEQWKKRAYAHLIAAPQWSGEFIKPVAAPSTESFGMTRLLNEELTSQHRGTDFPVKEGAPVVASNAGTVVLARELFYEGNCVIIDHGQHFFTIYMHLSKMDVKVGDRLKKEQRLGLSGATGRVTGPHLHMGVRWDGAYLNPVKLIALTLPETHQAVPRSTPRGHRSSHPNSSRRSR